MRLAAAAAAVSLLCSSGCRPGTHPGLPSNPDDLLASLVELDRPPEFALEGRLRTALGGVDMDLGLALATDADGNARVDLDYPFGGRALTLLLLQDGRLFGHLAERVIYSPDAEDTVHALLGPWASSSLLVDLLVGRVPRGFDGALTWERWNDDPMLGLHLANGACAMFAVIKHPARLDRMVLLDGESNVIARATWRRWTQIDGYWFPGDIDLAIPGRMEDLSVTVRRVDTSPDHAPDLFDCPETNGGSVTFESLLHPR